MPPKRAAAQTETKANATKRKGNKDAPAEKELPTKKSNKAAANKTAKEEANGETKPTRSNKKKAVATGTSKEPTNAEAEPATDSKKSAASKRAKAKKDDAAEKKEVKEKESKVESDIREKEVPAKNAKRGKKTKSEDNVANEAEPDEETATNEVKKGRKRRAAPETDKEPKDEPAPKGTKANATATNWDSVNFSCAAKTPNGKKTNFHITSWNVDGLRAWLKKGGLEILRHDKPDIFCLQETKCSDEKLPEEVKDIDGYNTYWCSSDKEGYAGVGIASKVKPLNVTYGIGSEEHDSEGRCITAEYEQFFLVNVYVPNAGRKLVTLPKRLEWNKIFKEHVKNLDEQKPVIICGDMNVAHTEIDLANPKTNTKNAGFTIEEREGMSDFLGGGYVDTFRKLYPKKEKAYTFWTYMSNSRQKNVGWRLDYFLVSNRFVENVGDNLIHSEVLGSDHCPLSLHVNI